MSGFVSVPSIPTSIDIATPFNFTISYPVAERFVTALQNYSLKSLTTSGNDTSPQTITIDSNYTNRPIIASGPTYITAGVDIAGGSNVFTATLPSPVSFQASVVSYITWTGVVPSFFEIPIEYANLQTGGGTWALGMYLQYTGDLTPYLYNPGDALRAVLTSPTSLDIFLDRPSFSSTLYQNRRTVFFGSLSEESGVFRLNVSSVLGPDLILDATGSYVGGGDIVPGMHIYDSAVSTTILSTITSYPIPGLPGFIVDTNFAMDPMTTYYAGFIYPGEIGTSVPLLLTTVNPEFYPIKFGLRAFVNTSETPTTFVLTAPTVDVVTFPNVQLTNQSSSDWFQYLSGNNTPTLTLSAPFGFQSRPAGDSLVLNVQASLTAEGCNVPTVYETLNRTIPVNPVVIGVTPTLTSPLTIANYQPFSYTFSLIPDTGIGVTLSSTGTSSALLSFITEESSLFSSSIGFTSPISNAPIVITPVIGTVPVGNSFSAVINSTISAITVTPPVPTGSISLYLYEPFSYVFTTNPASIGLTLQVSRSSGQILTYSTVSEGGTKVTFAGTYLFTSSSVLSLVVDLMYAGSIVPGYTVTIFVTVGRGRFFPPNQNQVFQLFQYEPVSTTFGTNPPFLTVLPVSAITSAPSLPNGLSFGNIDSNTWFLQGTPTLQSPQSNYTVFGSNSSTGQIVSVPISIRVNQQLVRITPSAVSKLGMVIGTAITPVVFVATEPFAVSRLYFQYTWDELPDGIGFYDTNGVPISSGYTASGSIQLLGTPTLRAAQSFVNSGITTYIVRLTGTQYQGGGIKVSGSSVITFSFAETVLFTTPIIPQLYATENLGYKNVAFEAATYFSTGSPIVSIVAPDLPPGLSLSSITLSGGRYRVTLLGTPTVVDQSGTTYAFTATNANGATQTQLFSIPILPDIVSFTESPVENAVFSYIVSKQIDPITFSASSSANKSITSWALSLSFSEYGLSLSASSGATVYLVGTPTNPLAQTAVTITAVDSLGTTVVRTILITIANDTFTWPAYTPTYIQNRPITPFQFQVTTASGRQIQSYSSENLPAGLRLSPSGLLSGTPTGSTGVPFTVTATTGYVSPPTGSQPYSYTIIPDNVLTLLNVSPTPISFTGTSFSVGNVFSAISYSGFAGTNSIVPGSISPVTSPPATFTLIDNVLSGTIPVYEPSFTFDVSGVSGSVTTTVTALLTLTESPLSGILTLPTSPGPLVFVQPQVSRVTLFQYCPMPTILFAVSGATGYVYYYSISSNLPIGMTFSTETTGTSATLTGIPASYNDLPVSVIVYAANGDNVTFTTVSFRILAPSFVNPQSGAGAYTALYRADVEGNAAQNARDATVFPQVDPLAGPLMAPRAPDVTTQLNCFMKLCKKPCPTCRSMF
jgi:hypothetical protein